MICFIQEKANLLVSKYLQVTNQKYSQFFFQEFLCFVNDVLVFTLMTASG